MIVKLTQSSSHEMGSQQMNGPPKDISEEEAFHQQYTTTAKSLLEDDEEDDDDTASRNPSDGGDLEERFPPQTTREDDHFSELDAEPAIPIPCTSSFPICQEELSLLTLCQGDNLTDQLELFQCRYPLNFLSVFHEHSSAREVVDLLPGMYRIPEECEYCGAEHTKNCRPNCQRPKSFFRKKRPPLCPRGPDWDPISEFHIAKAPADEGIEQVYEEEPAKSSFLDLGTIFGTKQGT